ncbi:MAG: hypothetical protein PHQ72_11615 [Hespellia sp.]|nr:hypothetical protein [Hespellia sp.]
MTKLGRMIFDDGVEKGREQGIQGMIETCAELVCTKEVTSAKLQAKFSLSQEEAQKYLDKYWK